MSDAPETGELPLVGGDFILLVTRLSIQGWLALGLIENPITKKKHVHPPGARMVLDDLEMLREKTRGNLAPEEEAHIERVLGDLSRALERVQTDVPAEAD